LILWKNNELIGVLLSAERGLTKQLPFSKLITLDCHMYMHYTAFFRAVSAITIVMSSEDYILKIYDMVIT
jgi:hypothetical protein